MNTIIKYSFFVFGILCLAPGCKKSELTSYEQPAMIFIYKDGYSDTRDSVSYSFAVKSPALQTDTVKVPVRIMGNASPKDRVVNLKMVADSSTAVEGVDFEFGPLVIPAGAFSADLDIIVKRNPKLKKEQVRLMLMIDQSADFLPGISNARASNATWGAGLTYLIKINDFFVKPDNWDTRLVYYFGAFSQVKFGFIIKVTGRTEFPHTGENALAFGEFAYYGALCKDKLLKYTQTNGPLMDESENEVTFP